VRAQGGKQRSAAEQHQRVSSRPLPHLDAVVGIEVGCRAARRVIPTVTTFPEAPLTTPQGRFSAVRFRPGSACPLSGRDSPTTEKRQRWRALARCSGGLCRPFAINGLTQELQHSVWLPTDRDRHRTRDVCTAPAGAGAGRPTVPCTTRDRSYDGDHVVYPSASSDQGPTTIPAS
jgi:hypothetical protein